MAQIADAFGAKQFFVAGASGGGPYALATTYYLPDRVLSTVVNCAAGSWGMSCTASGCMSNQLQSRSKTIFGESSEVTSVRGQGRWTRRSVRSCR